MYTCTYVTYTLYVVCTMKYPTRVHNFICLYNCAYRHVHVHVLCTGSTLVCYNQIHVHVHVPAVLMQGTQDVHIRLCKPTADHCKYSTCTCINVLLRFVLQIVMQACSILC